MCYLESVVSTKTEMVGGRTQYDPIGGNPDVNRMDTKARSHSWPIFQSLPRRGWRGGIYVPHGLDFSVETAEVFRRSCLPRVLPSLRDLLHPVHDDSPRRRLIKQKCRVEGT